MIEDIDVLSDNDIYNFESGDEIDADVEIEVGFEVDVGDALEKIGGKKQKKKNNKNEDDEDDEDDEEEEAALPENNYVNISDYKIRTIYIKPENNITSDVMSQYEKAEAVSIRIANISGGSDVFVDVVDLFDPAEMAKRELAMRRHPYNILKIVNEVIDNDKKEIIRYYEIWSPNEMMH